MITHLNASSLSSMQDLIKNLGAWQKDAPLRALDLSHLKNLSPYLRARVAGWISNGVDAELLVQTLQQLGAHALPGSNAWVSTFKDVGSTFDEKASRAKGMEACSLYIQASAFYSIARWPHCFSDEANECYQRSIACYERASTFFDCSFTRSKITFGDHTLHAHLYTLPLKADQRLPAVIVSGGMDAWKIDPEIQTITSVLLASGFAVCCIDMPGTGENDQPLGPNALESYEAVINQLKVHPRIDPDKIGFYGLSFGGHWAVRAALMRSDIKAAVNVGGPIHQAFQRKNFEGFERGARMNIARCFGTSLDTFDPEKFSRLALPGSLSEKSKSAKILSINGALDELVPISDIDHLDSLGLSHDKLIYGTDRHV
ncbi:MAG: esterase FrsA, partial [Alphaproteobacteria bacterium]|nr:esterase FrsA [Alphaproteobacteria bacterium]